MKDKKILNICLLTFGLVSLITFILPLKKFEFLQSESGFVKVMFYVLNAVLIVALITLIVLAIVNLFQDDYAFVKIMEAMALTGFSVVFLCLLIFAVSSVSKINVGYLLVAIEMFFTANFSQMARLIGSKITTKKESKPQREQVKVDDKKQEQNLTQKS